MSDILTNKINAFFKNTAHIRAHVNQYEERPDQQAMAHAVGQALSQTDVLVAEAGTGTGKTMAYLIPALLSDKKIIISTATKNLQEQIINQEIPRAQKLLGVQKNIQILKGRNNYLCIEKLTQQTQQMSLFLSGEERVFKDILKWSTRTHKGDKEELPILKDESPLWSQIDARAERCLGKSCPNYKRCFVVKHREDAQHADILVVNHHLFLSDLGLKKNNQKDIAILPDYDAVIFDEAHALYDIATEFLGFQFSQAKYLFLCHESISYVAHSKDLGSEPRSLILGDLEILARLIEEFFESIKTQEEREFFDLKKHLDNPIHTQHKDLILTHLKQLEERLSTQKDAPVAQNLRTQIQHLDDDFRAAVLRTEHNQDKNDDQASINANLYAHLIDTYKSNKVKTSKTIKLLPLEVKHIISEILLSQKKAYIFASATLRIHQKFDNFKKNLGIYQSQELVVDSPFNYSKQALLFIPKDIPEPHDPDFSKHLTDLIETLCKHAKGGAFLLFTSLKMMHQQYQILHTRLPFKLLLQGQKPKTALVQEFSEHGSAVLFASHSFWEGVDIQGHALRLVVIDKLPFASPSDPLVQARMQHIEKQGRSGFVDVLMPNAIMALKQGFGRLIRAQDDFGVVAIADARLYKKSYGAQFLKALPKAKQTTQEQDVMRFYQNFRQVKN